MRKDPVLIHLSDLHFGEKSLSLGNVLSYSGLFSKRIIGYLNHRLFRKKKFDPETKERVIEKLLGMEWDYLVISGDLTILAMEEEFVEAREALEPILQKGKVLLTPGNHDYYCVDATRPDLLAKYFGDCFPFDRKQEVNFLELNHRAILYEVNMAVPRPAFLSHGKICGNPEKIAEHMKNHAVDRTKLVVGHYPVFLPEGVAESFHHALANRSRMQRFLIQNEVDLYLHGHMHQSWRFQPQKDNKLTCINSGGCCRFTEGDDAGFHRITLGEEKTTIERIYL